MSVDKLLAGAGGEDFEQYKASVHVSYKTICEVWFLGVSFTIPPISGYASELLRTQGIHIPYKLQEVTTELQIALREVFMEHIRRHDKSTGTIVSTVRLCHRVYTHSSFRQGLRAFRSYGMTPWDCRVRKHPQIQYQCS